MWNEAKSLKPKANKMKVHNCIELPLFMWLLMNGGRLLTKLTLQQWYTVPVSDLETSVHAIIALFTSTESSWFLVASNNLDSIEWSSMQFGGYSKIDLAPMNGTLKYRFLGGWVIVVKIRWEPYWWQYLMTPYPIRWERSFVVRYRTFLIRIH